MPATAAVEAAVEPAAFHCGPLRLLEIGDSPFLVTRAGPGLPEGLSLLLPVEGQACVCHGRRSTRLGPGDLCLVSPGCEVRLGNRNAFRAVLVQVPTAIPDAASTRQRGRCLQHLDTTQPVACAASALTRYILAHGDHLAEDERVALGEALLRLVERLAPHRRCNTPTATDEGAVARQRRQAEAFILERLHDRRLDVARIAAHLGVSTRYLHRLFDGGQQVMRWVQEQRLQACRRDLSARGFRSVAEVAWAWGFASPAHFSRTFKKRFGVQPSAV